MEPPFSCVSTEQVENEPGLVEVDDVVLPSPTANETSSEAPKPENETDTSLGGFTGDDCQSDTGCVPDRTCLNIVDGPCAVSDEFCLCVPPVFVNCTSNADCVPGEVCTSTPEDEGAICISKQWEEESCSFTEVDPVDTMMPSVSPPAVDPVESPPPGGLTGNDCVTGADCLEDRTCQDGSGSCSATEDCVCIPPKFADCISSADCVEGEVCARIDDADPVCIS